MHTNRWPPWKGRSYFVKTNIQYDEQNWTTIGYAELKYFQEQKGSQIYQSWTKCLKSSNVCNAEATYGPQEQGRGKAEAIQEPAAKHNPGITTLLAMEIREAAVSKITIQQRFEQAMPEEDLKILENKQTEA